MLGWIVAIDITSAAASAVTVSTCERIITTFTWLVTGPGGDAGSCLYDSVKEGGTHEQLELVFFLHVVTWLDLPSAR